MKLKSWIKTIWSIALTMIVLTFLFYIVIGVKTVQTIENPKEAGKVVGKFMNEFKEGMEEFEAGIEESKKDTIQEDEYDSDDW